MSITAEQPFSEDPLSGETAESVEKWFKAGKPVDENPPTIEYPVEYPLSFKVRDFLIEKSFKLGDVDGRRMEPIDETSLYGLLLPKDLKPSGIPIFDKVRRFFRPADRWIGVIYCGERDSEWMIRIFGKDNIGELRDLALQLHETFGKLVTPRLSSEIEKRERRFF